MSEYSISQVYPSDKRGLAQIDALLQKEGITRDGNLDYICAMRDGNDEIIATGSCFGCTLRGFEEIGAKSFGIGGSFLRAFPLRSTQISQFL